MNGRSLKYLMVDILMRPMMPLGGKYLKASPRMITCREFNDFIYDYVEGKLTDSQTILFKRHMRVCPMCRNFLKTYIATYQAGANIFPYEDIEVPETVPQDLIDAIIDVKRKNDEAS